MLTKHKALEYTSFGVDDALAIRQPNEIPTDLKKVRFVGWQCGFEPLFVAVWSYLDVEIGDEDAEEMATDILKERNWFVDNENPPAADYVL